MLGFIEPRQREHGDGMMADAKQSESLSGTAATTPGIQTTAIRHVDRPDCGEIFADSINSLYFDGQSLRIEFAITRLDEAKPNAPLSGRRYPASRVVLSPTAAVELINRMQQVASALTQAGMLKATTKSTAPS
jgi:hypothetical protein